MVSRRSHAFWNFLGPNSLISKKSCKVAPIPGETKIWQYVSLFKRISLIDCPGVVVDTAGDTEVDSVLKGVVRAERLENPEEFIDAIQEKVKPEYIAAQYKLKKDSWTTSTQLMELIAQRSGRLRKGGDPCLRSAAIMIINDYQRGRLPHYVAPPELKTTSELATSVDASETKITSQIVSIEQNLDEIGTMHMEKETEDSENTESEMADNNQKEKSTELKTSPEMENEDSSTKMPTKNPVALSLSAQLIGNGNWED